MDRHMCACSTGHDHTHFVASCNHDEMIFRSLTIIESKLFGRGPRFPNPSSGHFHVLTREQEG